MIECWQVNTISKVGRARDIYHNINKGSGTIYWEFTGQSYSKAAYLLGVF